MISMDFMLSFFGMYQKCFLCLPLDLVPESNSRHFWGAKLNDFQNFHQLNHDDYKRI